LDELEKVIGPDGAKANMFSVMDRRLTDLAMSQLTPFHDEIAATVAHIENRLSSLNEALVSYVDAKQQQNEESIENLVHRYTSAISDLRQSIDTIRRLVNTDRQPSTSSADSPHHTASTSQVDVIDDALYVALENHFRGSRDLVADRQRHYLPMLPALIDSSAPLIDLGCGRGEWLKVIRDQGLPAIGVDSNSVCIAECREENLDVVQGDLLEFLSTRPNESVGTYTLFQVLEHLPFPVLVKVLREIRRSLVPGGRLIAEVPNAKNLRVSAGTFWIDPTHQRPLYPDLLMFLATEVGFSKAEGHFTNDLSPEADLSGLPDNVAEPLKSVIQAIDGPGDFALVATA
jgi:O-antigen chain-terminating methyltransferase